MKVDIHNHILPREWPNLKERYGYGGFIQVSINLMNMGPIDMGPITYSLWAITYDYKFLK